MENLAAYMREPETLYLKEVPIPVPGAEEVQVRIEYCGICGSDVHYYKDGRIGSYAVEGDFILGHEVAGIVTETGSAVRHLNVGDRVALEPGLSCGECDNCKQGKYNLCKDIRFFATPPVQGALQNYIVYPANMCFRLPEHVSTKEGALIEPLCVGLHACRQGGVTLGSTVVILGSGCIGLMTAAAAKSMGASEIIVVDLFEKRLEYALKMGATNVVCAAKEDTEDRIARLLGGTGADIVIETAGSEKTVLQTAPLAKSGGTVVLVGLSARSELPYNIGAAIGKELTIKTVFRYRNLYPVAISAVAGGKIDVLPVVTHEFTLEDAKEAFDTAVGDAESVVKAIIKLF